MEGVGSMTTAEVTRLWRAAHPERAREQRRRSMEHLRARRRKKKLCLVCGKVRVKRKWACLTCREAVRDRLRRRTCLEVNEVPGSPG